jgi:hypothetical protein
LDIQHQQPDFGRGVDGGVPSRGFGHVGEARACYDRIARVVKRLADIRGNGEMDSISGEVR